MKKEKNKITAPSLPESSPIVVLIENVSSVEQKFKLFGFNKFNGKPNFGNHADVRITSLGDSQITYDFMFNKLGASAFTIGKWRFESSNFFNMTQKLFKHEVFIFDGTYVRKEINLAILKDAYQQQRDLIDLTKIWSINPDTYLSGKISAKSSMVICMYPVATKEIKMNETSNSYEAPRLSALNAAPVIIQTRQTVKKTAKKRKPAIKAKSKKK